MKWGIWGMKGRLVDTLLIITLVLVAFGITYTLLTLNRGQTRPPPSRTVEDTARDSARDVMPVIPATPGSQGGNITPLVPGAASPLTPVSADAAADAAAGEAEGPATEAAGTVAVEVAEPAAPPRTLAAGEIVLERVGFSWVTGGAGACGVILEPWQHVAVSRELLADLGCGAAVTVHLDEPVAGRSSIEAVIGDTMNPTHSLTVNIYVAEDEPALQYGVAAGSLEAH
jgi:hypothetical protein